MRKLVFVFLVVLTVAGCREGEKNFTQYVDQYIGTGGHGHVFMGANVPFGAVQLGPTSIPQAWDWTSGYHISDTTVIGFAHTHLSGTGIGDLSDISLMPVVGDVKLGRGNEADPQSGMWSYFSRKNEKARPGYYATRLDRYGVDVELTATSRVGFHKYTFPKGADARVVIDLENGNNWDAPTECFIEKVSENTIEGYRYSTGWANDHKIYFYAQFSEPFQKIELFKGQVVVDSQRVVADTVFAQLYFNADQTLYAKVAISPVSIKNAKENMEVELSTWDFDNTVSSANDLWNKELSKIDIDSKDQTIKTIFYTSLYHTMIAPSIFSDVNGDYRGADGKMHPYEGFTSYTTFSLWDTYRAAQPLMTIIHPEKMKDVIMTMVSIYKQQGKLPVWHLMGCETDCMIGNPGVSVVADAIMKGVEGIDVQEAYQAMKNSVMLDERGQGLRKEYGYIPYDKYNESVASCMEYAIADWSVAQVAKKLGKDEDYEYFLNRSKSYKYYFDSSIGFFRGLSSEGKFRSEPLNPFESVHRDNDYTEGNGWQYTFLVPHDLEGLISLFGSKDKFEQKLDSLFVAEGDLGSGASPDISGLIGQYAHGNEPSHHVIYLYTMIDQPWKTAKLAREIFQTMYSDKPDGLSGNEDVGQMSAWYVLSSLGFYQVEPAGGRYYFGSPIVDQAKIKVKGGMFDIKVKNNSDANIYIQSITLNGEPYKNNYIDFVEIEKGGVLELEMGDQPKLWY